MRRRTALALLVAAMLLLAGCSNVPGASDSPPTDTNTPASTTTIGSITKTTTDSTGTTAATETTQSDATTTTTATDDRLAPGLAESGVTDAAALADAHAAILTNTSYTVRNHRQVRNESPTANATLPPIFRANTTTEVAHDPARIFLRYDVSGNASATSSQFPRDVELWAGPNLTLQAVETPNGTVYRRVRSRNVASGGVTGRDTLFSLFSTLNTTVAGTTTQNGTTLYRVNSTGVSDPALLASLLDAESVSNVSMTALVDADGLVHEYRIEYDATSESGTRHVTRATRYTALGETTVERPAWYDEAVNATANGTTTSD